MAKRVCSCKEMCDCFEYGYIIDCGDMLEDRVAVIDLLSDLGYHIGFDLDYHIKRTNGVLYKYAYIEWDEYEVHMRNTTNGCSSIIVLDDAVFTEAACDRITESLPDFQDMFEILCGEGTA